MRVIKRKLMMMMNDSGDVTRLGWLGAAVPLLYSEHGTYKTGTARFWFWLSEKVLEILCLVPSSEKNLRAVPLREGHLRRGAKSRFCENYYTAFQISVLKFNWFPFLNESF